MKHLKSINESIGSFIIKCNPWSQWVKATTNRWSTRDSLKGFTSFDFWRGGEMTSIDIEMADDIAQELYNYVKDISPSSDEIDDIYDTLHK